MKRTKKQSQYLDNLNTFISYLQNTNDITSPTHSDNIQILEDNIEGELEKEAFRTTCELILEEVRYN